jgi:hypothetical protein
LKQWSNSGVGEEQSEGSTTSFAIFAGILSDERRLLIAKRAES